MQGRSFSLLLFNSFDLSMSLLMLFYNCMREILNFLFPSNIGKESCVDVEYTGVDSEVSGSIKNRGILSVLI